MKKCKLSILIFLIILAVLLSSCETSEPTMTMYVSKKTPEPTATAIAKHEPKTITEYNDEAIFYCDVSTKWQKAYSGLVFGCSLEDVEIQIEIDGYTYEKTDKSNYVYDVKLKDEHINLPIKKMLITLFEDDEILKEYEFENVLFYYTMHDGKEHHIDNSYSAVEYLYFVSEGKQKELDSISQLKKLKMLSLNVNLINSTHDNSKDKAINNLEVLTELPKLQHLYIKDCVPEDIRAIDRIENLTSLKLDDTSIRNSYGLENLYNLEYFELCSYVGVNSSFFDNMISLRTLILRSCHNIDNELMNRVSKLSKLENLELYSCGAVTKIPDMSKTSIKSLIIDRCDFIEDIRGITGADNLISLKLLNLDSMTNIDCIREIESLEVLEIIRLNNVHKIAEFDKNNNIKKCKIVSFYSDFSTIVEGNNIEELVLRGEYDLDNYNFSKNIKSLELHGLCDRDLDIFSLLPVDSLEELYIEGGTIIGIEKLAECRNLKKLEIAQGRRYLDLSCIANLTSLEYLAIEGSNWNGFDSEAYVDDIAFLENLIRLEYLKINVSDKEHNYIPLTKLANLKELEISADDFYVPDDIVNLKKLETIYLGTCYMSDRNALSNLGQLKNVKELNMFDCCGWNIDDEYIDVDILFIGEMTGLEKLFICSGVTSYKVFPRLKDLTSLKELSLYDFEDINLDGIWDATSLEKLYLFGLDSVDVYGITNLVNIKELTIGSVSIENKEEILKLENLEFLHISGENVDTSCFENIEGLFFRNGY